MALVEIWSEFWSTKCRVAEYNASLVVVNVL